jgi:hypothetical protein
MKVTGSCMCPDLPNHMHIYFNNDIFSSTPLSPLLKFNRKVKTSHLVLSVLTDDFRLALIIWLKRKLLLLQHPGMPTRRIYPLMAKQPLCRLGPPVKSRLLANKMIRRWRMNKYLF